jgi:gliding motility-associated-like protein
MKKNTYPTRILYILPLLLSHFFTTQATHIVGGEFEVSHLFSNVYRLKLNVYFDNINGNPAAEDPDASVRIFRKSDNALMSTVTLARVSNNQFVNYTNPQCASLSPLSTRIIVYSLDVSLSPSSFDDPAGYYIVWERCCRNGTISNIQEPGFTGQTFYLEFPPIRRNGFSFINSSPTLLKPLNDFACINDLFEFDFSGTDPDGDSLVYSMAVPIRGHSSFNSPAPQASPAPYPLVTWEAPFNSNAQITGNLPLTINPKTGVLRLIANQAGLFVFAIRCEEYRNGVRIGLVQREYQLRVIDCPVNFPPQIKVTHPNGNEYQEGQVMQISGGEGTACFNFLATDSRNDVTNQLSVFMQSINFTASITGTIGNNDTARGTVCTNLCALNPSAIYRFLLIVQDNGCSLPKKDTIVVQFQVTPPPDDPLPIVTTSLLEQDTVYYFPNENIQFTVSAADSVGDNRTLLARSNIVLNQYGISFPTVSGSSASVSSNFNWNVDCRIKNLTQFYIDFVATDAYCNQNRERTKRIHFIRKTQDFSPIIGTDITEKLSDGRYKVMVQQGFEVSFVVYAKEQSNNFIKLGLANGLQAGMQFKDTTGKDSIASTFRWIPGCEKAITRFHEVSFAAFETICGIPVSDELKVLIEVIDTTFNPKPIAKTTLVTENISSNPKFQEITILSEDSITFDVIGRDVEGSLLTLQARGVGFDLEDVGMFFRRATGIDSVSSPFRWKVNCSHFKRKEGFLVRFFVSETVCITTQQDIFEVKIHVKDTNLVNFRPANIITPNGDGQNEQFAVADQLDDRDCNYIFADIQIYNRWGKLVYESKDKNFNWNAANLTNGTYFYLINFENGKKYRSWITVLR